MTTVNRSTDNGQDHHRPPSRRTRLIIAAAGLALAALVGGGSLALAATSATAQHPAAHSTATAPTANDWPWSPPNGPIDNS